MQITSVEAIPIRVGIDRMVPMPDPKDFRFVSHLCLVRIRTDEGLEGIGEANGSADWSGESQPGEVELIRERIAPLLMGEDPRDINKIMKKLERPVFGNPFAKAGVEMALYDILGKSVGAPLYRLLGGKVRPSRIANRFVVAPVNPDDAAALAYRMVQAGAGTVKVRAGRDTVAADVDRVRAVREAVGPRVRLTVDANCLYTVGDAIRAGRQMARYDVLLMEQPVRRTDMRGLAQVRRSVEMLIMADEAVFTVADAQECLRLEAADIISVYPGKNGGITNTVTITRMAEEAGVHCVIGSNMEWDVASAAMAHIAVALPNIQSEKYGVDIWGPLHHTEHALRRPIEIDPGGITVPEGPGLGIEIDWERLEALKV